MINSVISLVDLVSEEATAQVAKRVKPISTNIIIEYMVYIWTKNYWTEYFMFLTEVYPNML